MQDLNTLRDNIASVDFTTLSATDQVAARNVMTNLLSIIVMDTISNGTTDSVTNIMTTISTAQKAKLPAKEVTL